MQIPTYQYAFAMVSFVLTIVTYAPYIRSVLQHRVKPHVFSWFLWSFGNIVVFAAQWSKGGGLGAWLLGFSGVLCLTVAVLSLKYGEKNITRLDWTMFIAALLAIPLWSLTNDPLSAVILLTTIDALAAVPTMRKSYHKPFEESVWLFFLSAVRFAFSIPALEQLNLTTVLFPFVICLTNFVITALLVWRRAVLKENRP